jgi:hypothetical protein
MNAPLRQAETAMPKLGRLLAAAARRIAADPRVRSKISATVENDIKPRAKQAWDTNKPKLEAKAAEWNKQIREKATRENFDKLTGKLRDRLRERPKEN